MCRRCIIQIYVLSTFNGRIVAYHGEDRCSRPHARYTDVFNESIALADWPRWVNASCNWPQASLFLDETLNLMFHPPRNLKLLGEALKGRVSRDNATALLSRAMKSRAPIYPKGRESPYDDIFRKGIELKFLNRDVVVDDNSRESGDVDGA
ncbi:hypothetical protein VNO80_14362 [Phaseolus coccineus]|uniref:Uncharacterized protein n=1 Tax=Phaseolus coccineus TaxID=3886 RepID=A0AAN9MN87_PHACN